MATAREIRSLIEKTTTGTHPRGQERGGHRAALIRANRWHWATSSVATQCQGEGDRAGPRRYSIISRVPAKVRSTFAKV